MIKEKIENLVNQALAKLGVPEGMVKVVLDHPADPSFGDYSTNVAMLLAKSLSMPFPGTSKKPIDLAQKIASEIEREISGSKDSPVKSVAAAQPGFINFHLSNKFFADSLKQVLSEKVWYGKNTRLWNKKIIIEHTNLNPFKPFHIGHLVNNAIGESLSRILEFQDVKLTRASYGGDVGLHVAKTLWGVMKREDVPSDAEAETKAMSPAMLHTKLIRRQRKR
jgi:arginyl-tRNA synthetase